MTLSIQIGMNDIFFIYHNDKTIFDIFFVSLIENIAFFLEFFCIVTKVVEVGGGPNTAQKIKFYIKGFFSKRDPIRSFLRIWSQLL